MTVPRVDKQRALLDGALRVFARDGYARASIDALAAESGVSSRTIYNHYGDKAALFRAVILDSAHRVAAHEIDQAGRLLGRILDLEDDLVTFGLAWSTPDPVTETHFALVRHVRADAVHIDPATLDAWQQAGPLRVRGALAGHLRRHADAGLLEITDEMVAALHLVQLTSGCVAHAGPGVDTQALVRVGVRAFLRAYGSAGATERTTART